MSTFICRGCKRSSETENKHHKFCGACYDALNDRENLEREKNAQRFLEWIHPNDTDEPRRCGDCGTLNHDACLGVNPYDGSEVQKWSF